MAAQYPVVTITGPRQSGKTTLAQTTFPGYGYFSLENPDTREQIQNDPRAFLESNSKGIIIDEFQHVPEILSFIQGVVDKTKQKGLYILTGSNQLLMLGKVNQSLAGRTALLKLLPFSINEIRELSHNFTVDKFITTGFYPGIYSNQLNPYKAYRNYYETYIERDVRQISNIQNIRQFQLFVRLCAGRIGQLFNANALANEVGVSNKTIKHWISILETSFVVFMLPPWHANIKKRLVKSPKIYFYDVGLAAYSLGIEEENHLTSHPLRGALFENMIVMELVKIRFNAGIDSNLYFYRDNHGNEVDVIQEKGHLLDLFEIKSSMTFHSGFLKGLNYLKKLVPERIQKSTLVYAGKDEFITENHSIINFKKLIR
jgi:predicted AAA+ superfamily ATPase